MEKNDNDIQITSITPQLKSPAVEAWKAGITSALTWFAGMSLFSVVLGKAFRPASQSVHRALGGGESLQIVGSIPQKAMDIFKRSFFSNALWATMFGTFDASRAASNTAHENKETTLMAENAMLHNRLGETDEVLDKLRSAFRADHRAGSFSEKALADKAVQADAKHNLV